MQLQTTPDGPATSAGGRAGGAAAQGESLVDLPSGYWAVMILELAENTPTPTAFRARTANRYRPATGRVGERDVAPAAAGTVPLALTVLVALSRCHRTT